MTTLFVYGTLKPGYSNYEWLLADKDIKHTPAWTHGKLYDLGAFPAMTKGDGMVYGDLLKFDDPEILERIDILEGYKTDAFWGMNFYDRVEVTVHTENSESVVAWTYVLSESEILKMEGVLILSGNWSER